jgi:glycosyltransferase involved in cell wall biosynthesis
VRVAIAHHWFVTRGGGERVAAGIASLFPTAEIYTLLADEAGIPDELRGHKLHTSFLQQIPLAKTNHRHLMPLYPRAVESLDLRGYDLVISSDSGPIKGVRVDAGATHICYCHSPMRYLYDGYEAYRSQMGPVIRAVFTATAGPVRRWDTEAAKGVTHFLANSNYVADRIRRCYGRESTVIHPPIDLHRARSTEPGRHYLCAGRLVGYKHTEMMIAACQGLGRPLRVAGTGPELARIQRVAGPGVKVLGELTAEELWSEYASCRALLFAADEDFGMVPLEAQACGKPVIAYGFGGSLETVRGSDPGRTGVFYPQQTVESLSEAIVQFEALADAGAFQPSAIRAWAEDFRTEVFLRRLREFILHVQPAAGRVMAPEGN